MGDKKEYIERGALIRLFDERYITAIVQQKHDDVPEDHKKHWKGVQSGTNWCKNTVLEAPAADVVEVVRCCDCKYCETVIHSVIDEPQWFCTRMVRAFDVDPTSFCSYSERREQNGV